MSLEELMKIKGIGRVKAIQLKAVGELSARMNKPSNYRRIKITSPEEIAGLLMNELRLERKEVVKNKITNENKTEVKKSPKRVNKIGRNDPCPCGSGKKYKNCCGK